MKKIGELIRKLPKAELHTHIDGDLAAETIIQLADKAGIPLPSKDPKELSEILFKDRYRDLVDYLKNYDLFTALMQTPEAVERIAYEFAWHHINEGVFFLEGRFAPQQHVGRGIPDIVQAIILINNGMSRAAKEYNSRPEVVKKEVPEFKYGIICCILRAIFPGAWTYYNKVFDTFKYSDVGEAKLHAGMELVRASIEARDKHGVPVVAIDLAGKELDNPCEDFAPAFDLARKHMFNITIHAGEADGPESVYNAVLMGAQRVGHALHLFDAKMTKRPNAEKFCNDLAEYMAAKGVAVESCLTSNLQTCGLASQDEPLTLPNHPAKKMLEKGLAVSFSCDSRSITKSSVSHELELAVENFGLDLNQIKSIVLGSFQNAFFPGTKAEKMKYVEEVRKYYDKIEQEYAGK